MATQVANVGAAHARRIGFYTVVALGLALVVFGLGEAVMLGVVAWLGESALEEAAAGAGAHLLHVHALSLFTWLLLVSMAIQLFHPERKLAPAVLALTAMIIYSVGTLTSATFDPLEAVAIVLFAAAVWLSPGREGARVTPFQRRALLASVPILIAGSVVTVTEMGRQVSGVAGDAHVEFGHYGLVSTVAVMVVMAALIGASPLSGSRIVAWLVVGALIYVGVASMLYPNQASSLGASGGPVAVATGLLYGWGALARTRLKAPLAS